MEKLYKNYKHPFLPQNYIAEEILLGIILIYPETLVSITRNIKKEYFFLESHKLIYTNLIEIHKSKKINILELLNKLQRNKVLWQIGGVKRIINLMKQSQIFIYSSKTNNYTRELIYLISKNYYQRLIIQYGHNIIKLGYISKIKNTNLLSKVSNYLSSLHLEQNSIYKNENSMTNFKDLMSKQLIEIKYNVTNNTIPIIQEITKSGFHELDEITYGLPNGDLIIIAGRPSTGKTSLAINIAYNIFSNTRGSICIFSLEMSSRQILNKFISIASEIPIHKQKINKLNHKEWEKVTQLCKKLLHKNIYINEQNNMNFEYIEETAKEIKKKMKI